MEPLFGRRRRTSEHKADVRSRQLLPDRKPQDFLIGIGEPPEDAEYFAISFATNNNHVHGVIPVSYTTSDAADDSALV